MASLTPRQTDIVQLARHSGRVDVDALAATFDVTPQTIRKDLNDLCELGILQRYHGGAMLGSGVANLAYESRRELATDAKSRIGAHAARLIPNDCSLFINIGTTTEQVAQALRRHTGLMVITNNLNVARILQGAADIEVVIAGGLLRHTDGGIVGDATVEFIRQFKVDFAIVGASAIDPDGSLLDFDYREVSVSKAIMAGARRTLLVADRMKFARAAPVRIGHLSSFDWFITDAAPPAAIARICADHDVAVEIVADVTASPREPGDDDPATTTNGPGVPAARRTGR